MSRKLESAQIFFINTWDVEAWSMLEDEMDKSGNHARNSGS